MRSFQACCGCQREEFTALFQADSKLPFIPLDTSAQAAADAALDAVPDAFDPQKLKQDPSAPATVPKASAKATLSSPQLVVAPQGPLAEQPQPEAPLGALPPPPPQNSFPVPEHHSAPVPQSPQPATDSLKEFSPGKKNSSTGTSPVSPAGGFSLSPIAPAGKSEAASDTDSAPPLPQESDREDGDILVPAPPPSAQAPHSKSTARDPAKPSSDDALPPALARPPTLAPPASAARQHSAAEALCEEQPLAANPVQQPIAASPVVAGAESWTCAKCTFTNLVTATVCDACGGPRYAPQVAAPRQEFVVEIVRTPGEPVGLDIDHIDGVSAVVEAVKPGGAVHLWNQSQLQDLGLREGDRIVEVNGARDDVQKIIARLKNDLSWHLVFHRPVELAIVIDKQDASTLGLDLKYAPNSKSLLITDVAKGPMHDWNVANPDAQVMPHDRIVSINGVRGKPQDLIEASDGLDHLDVVIARYPALALSTAHRRPAAVDAPPPSNGDRPSPLSQRQAPPQAAAPALAAGWACKACTYVNKLTADSCAACGTRRWETECQVDGLAGQQFIADIERKPGDAVGLDIDHIDGVAAVIESVKPGGAIHAWNAQHADFALKENDRIVEVNGAAGDVKMIIQKLKTDVQWRLVVQRPVEILITIRKTDSNSLGLDLNYAPNSKSLLITDVSNGPMQDWNMANPEQAIIRRDRIIEINGVRGRPMELIHASEGEDVLQMVIAHYEDNPSL